MSDPGDHSTRICSCCGESNSLKQVAYGACGRCYVYDDNKFPASPQAECLFCREVYDEAFVHSSGPCPAITSIGHPQAPPDESDACVITCEEGIRCRQCDSIVLQVQWRENNWWEFEQFVQRYPCACEGPTPVFIYGGNPFSVTAYIEKHGKPEWLIQEEERAKKMNTIYAQKQRFLSAARKGLESALKAAGVEEVELLERDELMEHVWLIYDKEASL
jgi:hypothetical protein